ncbi:11085_t:CDS:1, partial [Dentiscutata erythropus]
NLLSIGIGILKLTVMNQAEYNFWSLSFLLEKPNTSEIRVSFQSWYQIKKVLGISKQLFLMADFS